MSEARPDLGPLRAALAELPPPERDMIADRAFPFGTSYCRAIDAWWEAFAAAGFPGAGQHDYSTRIEAYCATHGIEDGIELRHVAAMDRDSLLNLLRLIQREERFCDGAWADWHRRGMFHAIAERCVAIVGRMGRA